MDGAGKVGIRARCGKGRTRCPVELWPVSKVDGIEGLGEGNMSQGAAFGSRWWIVFGATLSMLVAQGPVILYTLGLFIKPLNQEFGWDRASISAAGGIAAISSAITIPFVGSMMDRSGVRAVLLPIVLLCAPSVALIALP